MSCVLNLHSYERRLASEFMLYADILRCCLTFDFVLMLVVIFCMSGQFQHNFAFLDIILVPYMYTVSKKMGHAYYASQLSEMRKQMVLDLPPHPKCVAVLPREK